jgi:hypothetical protein
MRRLLQGVALGGALAYFFDSQSGARRRNTDARPDLCLLPASRTQGRSCGSRRDVRGVRRFAEGPASPGRAEGLRRRDAHAQGGDGALPAADVPKGQINVNVENGVVVLRGEVDSWDMVDDLVGRARSVQGVRDVENLLHLPGQPLRRTTSA